MSYSLNKTTSSKQNTRDTRPQTAVTYSKSPQQILVSVPTEDASAFIGNQQQHTNPTSLTPRSLKKLQNRKLDGSKSEIGGSSFLRVTKDQAEMGLPENYFVKEIQANSDDYDKFKKNFHKIVFDAFGNYLYTKPDPQGEEQKQQVFSALSSKTNCTSSNLKRKLMVKTQSFQPRKIVDNLVKSSQEIAQMNPRRKNILDAKQRAESTLNLMVQNLAKEKILIESRSQLQQTTSEMLNDVDKFIRENQILQDQLEMARNQILEMHSANESLNFKNQTIQKELKQTKSQLDEIKRASVDLEKFIPQYKIIQQKFPNLSAEKVIDRYEYFETTAINLTKKVGDLEEDIQNLEKNTLTMRRDYEQKLQDMTLNRQHIPISTNTAELEQELKDAMQYKDQYMGLFNRILELYCDWTSKTKAFLPDKIDSGPRSKLVDPLEMLSNMEKMIKISSTEKTQSYLRKIIVSANLLQRKYIPENVNLKFDPDKIYDRITKLVDNLNAQIFKLQRQYSQLLLKTGMKPDDQEPEASQSYITGQVDEYNIIKAK